ncbi:MAG: DNA topoisomerase IV subunit A [Pseudomonadota bacterium]
MTDTPILEEGSIEPINLRTALEERYLAYALSTIMHRALPDVRDGLKPVHRRLLYAMRELKLDPASGFKKCARVVGDVMGKFHPHGDQAIYDALVRLAQDFAVRYPLIDGQGNFGNIDGDNPAAMRYTEARMTDVASLLLDGIDEDTVDFRETYDGLDKEPIVLPANFPNLLANGSSGIAVGMATNIPPHNVAELCDAAIHLIKHPNASIEKLVDFIPGPDFPTGGIIIDTYESIVETYKTGRGSFRVRAYWEQEDIGRGGYQIVVTEIPYQVQKSRLVEKLADLITLRKLPILGDVRDESDENVRLVLEPKSKTVDPVIFMESLFKLTDLETRISLNMNVLSYGQVPNVLSLREVLRQWLDHRKVVLVRRSEFRLKKIEHRLEVLEGYLIAYLNLDEVIRIIREEDEPKKELIATFDLTEVQAEAILNMRLRSLRKLEELEIRKEHKNLNKERREIKALLKSDEKQWTHISDEIKEVKQNYAKTTELGKRRTTFANAEDIDIDLETALIEKEPITVVLSEKGWVRTMKGHLEDTQSLQFKTGDKLKFAVKAWTTDKLVLFTTNGKFFTFGADTLPGGRGHGEPIRLMIDLDDKHTIVHLFVHNPERQLLVASRFGNGFIVDEKDVVASTRKGKQILNVTSPDEAAICTIAKGDHVAVIGKNRKLLIFPLKDVNHMSRGRGIRLQKYTKSNLSDVSVFYKKNGLSWVDGAGRTRQITDFKEWKGERAQAGKLPPKGFPKSNLFGPKFE